MQGTLIDFLVPRECDKEGVPYLPAVKQVPLAAPMVENATKSGTTQDAG